MLNFTPNTLGCYGLHNWLLGFVIQTYLFYLFIPKGFSRLEPLIDWDAQPGFKGAAMFSQARKVPCNNALGPSWRTPHLIMWPQRWRITGCVSRSTKGSNLDPLQSCYHWRGILMQFQHFQQKWEFNLSLRTSSQLKNYFPRKKKLRHYLNFFCKFLQIKDQKRSLGQIHRILLIFLDYRWVDSTTMKTNESLPMFNVTIFHRVYQSVKLSWYFCQTFRSSEKNHCSTGSSQLGQHKAVHSLPSYI